MDLKIAVPEQTVLNRPAQAALDLIQSMVIDSDEMFGEAGEELRRIKSQANSARRTATTPEQSASITKRLLKRKDEVLKEFAQKTR